MAGSAAIFRVTNTGDNEGNVGSTEKIEFNQGAVPDATGRMVATGFRMVRDVSFHPNPRRALDKIQDNLLGTLEVTLTGYFIDHDQTAGPINLFNWSREDAQVTDFPFGRFGIRLDDFAQSALNLTPSAATGYILYDIDVQDLERPRDEVGFIAKFYRDGTI